MKLSIEEVKQKTLELIGSNDVEDVAYITEEMVQSDLELPDDAEITAEALREGPYYGHNMRYSNRRLPDGNIYQVYVISNGGNWTQPSAACGTSHTGWMRQDSFDHHAIGKCGRYTKFKFTER